MSTRNIAIIFIISIVALLLIGVFLLKKQTPIKPLSKEDEVKASLEAIKNLKAKEKVTVNIGQNGFEPSKIDAKPYTTIVFVNKTEAEITVNILGTVIADVVVKPGGTVESPVFTNVGKYTYTNSKDKSQAGTLEVKE